VQFLLAIRLPKHEAVFQFRLTHSVGYPNERVVSSRHSRPALTYLKDRAAALRIRSWPSDLAGILNIFVEMADLLALDANSRRYVMKFIPSGGISDCSGITAFNVSGEVVRTLAQTPLSHKSPIPWLLVAPRDVHYGMARMYQIIASDLRANLQVVRGVFKRF